MTPAGRPDVIVVGAGFAGVAAATSLAERGARVLVLETRRRLCAAGFQGAALIQASAEDLPFAANSFDHVLAVTVLGEIPDRSQALREIRRVLRPGGRLSVSEQLPDPDFIPPGSLRRELRGSGFVEEATPKSTKSATPG